MKAPQIANLDTRKRGWGFGGLVVLHTENEFPAPVRWERRSGRDG
jgi:hypothetical protein